MSKIKIYPDWLPCPDCAGVIEVWRPADARSKIFAECVCRRTNVSIKSIVDSDSIMALDGAISWEEKVAICKEWNKEVLRRLDDRMRKECRDFERERNTLYD